jgi:hypothetical protein
VQDHIFSRRTLELSHAWPTTAVHRASSLHSVTIALPIPTSKQADATREALIRWLPAQCNSGEKTGSHPRA